MIVGVKPHSVIRKFICLSTSLKDSKNLFDKALNWLLNGFRVKTVGQTFKGRNLNLSSHVER